MKLHKPTAEELLYLKRFLSFNCIFPHLLQASDNKQVKFDCHVLLHEMVSQVTSY